MNQDLNRQPVVTNATAKAVETAMPSAQIPEKKSVMAKIASVSSGIFGKIKRVMPFVNSAEVATPAPAVPNLPDYKPVAPAAIAPKDTLVYQPPMEIPRRGAVAGVAAQRSTPDLSKDLFAHLSDKPSQETLAGDAEKVTQTLNGYTSAKLSVYPAGSAPRARVKAKTAPAVDFKFEYREPVENHSVNLPAPDLSNVFNRNAVVSARPMEAATIQPKKITMTALEDVNNYVAEQDRKHYADLAARRSRGIVKNLSLWTTQIKEDVISAVAPNYVMKKAYEAAQSVDVTPAPKPAAVSTPVPVQAKPSLFSRLKTGYENAKATMFPKARKLAAVTALAGAAMGLNASEQSSSQPVGVQKTALAYAAKAVAKFQATPSYNNRVSSPLKAKYPASDSAPKVIHRAKPAPAVNAPSLNSTVAASTASTDSITDAYIPKSAFHNGIYRGYQGPSDGSAPVSRTSLCAR